LRKKGCLQVWIPHKRRSIDCLASACLSLRLGETRRRFA
jgi:hypothetical protein